MATSGSKALFEDRFYTASEVAQNLAVTRSCNYFWVKEGRFPLGVKLGTARRFFGPELNAWLEARRVKGAGASGED